MNEIAKLLTIIELNLTTLGRQYKSGQAVLISDALEALTKVRHLTSHSSRAVECCALFISCVEMKIGCIKFCSRYQPPPA